MPTAESRCLQMKPVAIDESLCPPEKHCSRLNHRCPVDSPAQSDCCRQNKPTPHVNRCRPQNYRHLSDCCGQRSVLSSRIGVLVSDGLAHVSRETKLSRSLSIHARRKKYLDVGRRNTCGAACFLETVRTMFHVKQSQAVHCLIISSAARTRTDETIGVGQRDGCR